MLSQDDLCFAPVLPQTTSEDLLLLNFAEKQFDRYCGLVFVREHASKAILMKPESTRTPAEKALFDQLYSDEIVSRVESVTKDTRKVIELLMSINKGNLFDPGIRGILGYDNSLERGYIRPLEEYSGKILSIGGTQKEREALKGHPLYVINMTRETDPDLIGTLDDPEVGAYFPAARFKVVMIRAVPMSQNLLRSTYQEVLRILEPGGKFIGRLANGYSADELREMLTHEGVQVDVFKESNGFAFEVTRLSPAGPGHLDDESLFKKIRQYVAH